MTGRDIILGRIREALRSKAPAPAKGSHSHPGAGSKEPPRHWLPPVPDTHEGRIALFAQNSAALKTAFHRVPSLDEAGQFVAQLVASAGWKRLASHRHPLTSALAEAVSLPVIWMEDTPGKDALETCDLGLTTCEALIAQTGSVMVSSTMSGGRNLSVLPPAHLVIAREEQVTGDLAEAFALARKLHARQWPSMLSLITGPSRTGDIERILVLGAHGPKQLFILLVP